MGKSSSEHMGDGMGFKGRQPIIRSVVRETKTP